MKTSLRIGWILLCLALALAARSWNLRDVFVDGKIYFVDADCYSRMTRARIVYEHLGAVLRHHDFENWPQGIAPHTTAPFDYLIVGLKGVLEVVVSICDPQKTSVLSGQTLDLAGALISPLLGVAAVMWLAWWYRKFRVRFWGVALFVFAVSPILVHGTLLGRPDHQSLLLFLLTIALTAELALVFLTDATDSIKSRRRWAILSGLAWALSLWVSLYEPLILTLAVTMFWGGWRWRECSARHRRPWAISFGIVLALALVIEGWRVSLPDPTLRTYFSRWQQTIGELTHLNLGTSLLFAWLGWMALASPILLFLTGRRDRRAVLLLVLVGATFALTVWQLRWGYYLALVFVLALPWQMQAWRRPWMAWLFVSLGIWPILQDWDRRLFADGTALDGVEMRRAETVALRQLVTAAMHDAGGPFLAPWWLSPSIAYWSKQPGVAGSSHESLSGIVDTARFYLSSDLASVAKILRDRRVRWVLADEAEREIATSAVLLGVERPLDPFATVLYDHPAEVPEFLREWKPAAAVKDDGLRFYRLYEVDASRLPP